MEDTTTTVLQADDDLARVQAVVTELLRAGGGRVSTQRVRQQLEQQGITNPQQVIARLKFSDAETVAFRHHGRSFYTPEAFQALTVEIDRVRRITYKHRFHDGDRCALLSSNLMAANRAKSPRHKDARQHMDASV